MFVAVAKDKKLSAHSKNSIVHVKIPHYLVSYFLIVSFSTSAAGIATFIVRGPHCAFICFCKR